MMTPLIKCSKNDSNPEPHFISSNNYCAKSVVPFKYNSMVFAFSLIIEGSTEKVFNEIF